VLGDERPGSGCAARQARGGREPVDGVSDEVEAGERGPNDGIRDAPTIHGLGEGISRPSEVAPK
jgi:hypothetical protein